MILTKIQLKFLFDGLQGKGLRLGLSYSMLAKPLLDFNQVKSSIDLSCSDKMVFTSTDSEGLTYDFSNYISTDTSCSPPENKLNSLQLCKLMWKWNFKKRYDLTIFSFRSHWEPLNSNLFHFKNNGENIKMINLVLSAYFKANNLQEGWSLFHSLPQKNLIPDQNTIKIVLSYCLKTKNWKNANAIYESIPSLYNFVPCSVTTSLYCSILLHQGQLNRAIYLFNSQVSNSYSSSILAFHIFIKELCISRRVQEALSIFKMFRDRGFVPTQDLFNNLLDGLFKSNLSNTASLLYQNLVINEGLVTPDHHTFYILINGFVGELNKTLAYHYLDLMQSYRFTKIHVSEQLWHRLIHLSFTSRNHSQSELASDLIEHMKLHFEIPKSSKILNLHIFISKILSDKTLIIQSDFKHNNIMACEVDAINQILNSVQDKKTVITHPQLLTFTVQRLCQFGGVKYARYLLDYFTFRSIRLNSVIASIFLTTGVDCHDTDFAKFLWKRLILNNVPLNSTLFSNMILCLCRSSDPHLALKFYYSMRAENHPVMVYPALKVYHLAKRLRQHAFAKWLIQDSLFIDKNYGLTQSERLIVLSKLPPKTL